MCEATQKVPSDGNNLVRNKEFVQQNSSCECDCRNVKCGARVYRATIFGHTLKYL